MAELHGKRGHATAGLAIDNYTGTPDELLEQAQRCKKQIDVPVLLLAAVNKKLAEIAPGEELRAAANRVTVEWDKWAIEGAYELLTWYYEDSLNPNKFNVSYGKIEHEDYLVVAEDMFRVLKNGNG